MMSSEGVESGELNPSSTKLELIVGIRLITRFEETASVRTHERNAEHVEVHYSSDGVVKESPFSVIVSKPVSGMNSRPSEGASGENEGPIVFKRRSIISSEIVSGHF
jgi:hypothetical protein